MYDVAVDLRKGSPTFGKYHGVILSEENKKQFLYRRDLRMDLLFYRIMRSSATR